MKRTLMLLMGAALSLPACVDEPDAPPPPEDDRWEAFQRSARLIAEHPLRLYIYGGDMLAVGDDGLRRAYERYFGPSQPAEHGGGYGVTASPLTIDRVNGVDQLLRTTYSDSGGGRYNVTYCVQRSTFTAAQLTALDAALPLAIDSWNGLVNVSFRHDKAQDASCGVGNTSVFFNVRNNSDGAFFARAFFPEDPRAARELLIDDSAFTTTSGGRDLQGILRHETGHILGFRHEHIWLGDCSAEGIGDAVHITSYDESSVMHYPQCRESGGGGYRQTLRDFQGATQLYGLATAQILNL